MWLRAPAETMKLFSVLLAPQLASLLKVAGSAAFAPARQAVQPPSDHVSNWEGGVTYRPAEAVKDHVSLLVAGIGNVPSDGQQREPMMLEQRGPRHP